MFWLNPLTYKEEDSDLKLLDDKLGASFIYRIHATIRGEYIVATSGRLLFYSEDFVRLSEVTINESLKGIEGSIKYITEAKRDNFYVFTSEKCYLDDGISTRCKAYSVKRERKSLIS